MATNRTIKIFIIFLCALVIFPNPVYAQTANSNSVITRVGNAPDDKRPVIDGIKGTAPAITDAELQQALIDKFGLSFVNEYEAKHMRWAWEKMWEISNTNFNQRIHGRAPVIQIRPDEPGRQVNCSLILLGKFDDPILFKLVLTHELGHIIYHCGDTNGMFNGKKEHDELYKGRGGTPNYLTEYGATHFTENYAEMIAYYLNPGVSERTTRKHTNANIPFAGGRHPDFFDLAVRILGNYPQN